VAVPIAPAFGEAVAELPFGAVDSGAALRSTGRCCHRHRTDRLEAQRSTHKPHWTCLTRTRRAQLRSTGGGGQRRFRGGRV